MVPYLLQVNLKQEHINTIAVREGVGSGPCVQTAWWRGLGSGTIGVLYPLLLRSCVRRATCLLFVASSHLVTGSQALTCSCSACTPHGQDLHVPEVASRTPDAHA